MQITPVNLKIDPIFTSRYRVDQNHTNKLYEGQFPPVKDELHPIDRSMLSQRFDFNEYQADLVCPLDKTYDSFTGLRDKNYLLASLYAEMQRAQNESKNLSIAIFDMDDFKSVNEFLGYEIGDIFIKEISREITETAQKSGVDAYRFGGEEFILIFDNQTEEEKEEIAKEIEQRANSNRVIQAYKNQYMRNAQSRLDKALYSTAKVQKISILKTKRETLEEVLESLTTEAAKNDPFFIDAINEISSQIDTIYANLINECLLKEKDEKNAYMLQNLKAKLLSGEKLLKSEQRVLDEYLFSVYDKANEIYQTKKWLSDFRQNGGFGITCGVVNFEPESLEYQDPMDIVDKAGRVLKKGKNTRKGQVYVENIKL